MSRYDLGEKFAGVYFTQREAEIMAFIMRGKKHDDVAEFLGLSARTTEFYFCVMKEKLGANTKFELIDMVLTSDFPQFKDALITGI